MKPSFPPAEAVERQAEPTPDNIRELVDAFYRRVRADALLGPIFGAALDGRWEEHMPKMTAFWSSLVLGAKQYRGNVQQAHAPLPGIEPRHFSHWLYLFLDTVEGRYEPAAAVRFMEPALRIAQSLQLSRFGWDYQIPAEQQALLDRVAPRLPREGDDERDAAAKRPRGEPFPAKIIGRPLDEPDTDDNV
ncbi:group III truncated hemoglobin [Paraburkholderia phosphatilytica]|uniref:group III truncated hemoglobin n=1 Tax=Paraburkholderia phosphatilytica TaxID=2282883 RepID=UPI000E4BFDBF|nr:group III truncated hemoglobin [Paraburkholderia phosphatilytica]